MPTLADIPVEVLVDNILPLIPLEDIPALTVASKAYAALCSDDTFWKRKLKEDYNFSDTSSARIKGYKFLYKGVRNAKPYVWGSASEGRLGYVDIDRQGGILRGSVPYPKEVRVHGSRIVELAAGGWSFHALDSEGYVFVWGRLDGSDFAAFHADPFSNPTKRTDYPSLLDLPERITKIGCGRAHATALSSENRVLVFTSWGRPYFLTTPLLATSHEFTTPLQVESGWAFSAVLTNGGDVYVWWPFDGEFGELDRIHEEESVDRVEDDAIIIYCRPWEVNINPLQIGGATISLPNLRGEEEEVGHRIVKIAAGDNFLIGLTEGGHVLKVDFPDGQASFNNPLRRPKWEYLEYFSEVKHIRAHPTFNPVNREGEAFPEAPETLQITHISAHFLRFFAYSVGSSSVVLQGSKDVQSSTQPSIPPSLQNRDIISVVLGDYHFGAMTSTGKLLTWGAYSLGALGLGDPTRLPLGTPGGYVEDSQRERAKRFSIIPPEVVEPAEVKFGTRDGSNGRKSFVFNATAAGWQTGALVIDLDDRVEMNKDDTEVNTDGSSTHTSLGLPRIGNTPFRIGLAGALRGGGRGRGRGGT